MRRLRTDRRVILLCIVLVLSATVAVALWDTHAASRVTAVLTALWMVFPVIAAVVVRRRAANSNEQRVSLLSLSFFRAPPSL
jgi:F0F1-type ATP synthase assembly protein I